MRKKCHSIGKLLSRGGRGGVKVGGEGRGSMHAIIVSFIK